MKAPGVLLVAVLACSGCNAKRAATDATQQERQRVLAIFDEKVGKRISAGDIASAKLLSGVRSEVASGREVKP